MKDICGTNRMERPFRAMTIFFCLTPARCAGLVWNRPFGALASETPTSSTPFETKPSEKLKVGRRSDAGAPIALSGLS